MGTGSSLLKCQRPKQGLGLIFALFCGVRFATVDVRKLAIACELLIVTGQDLGRSEEAVEAVQLKNF